MFRFEFGGTRKLMRNEKEKLKKKRQNSFTSLLFSSNFPIHDKYERKLVFIIFSYFDSAFLFAIQFVHYIANGLLVRAQH